MPPLRSVLLVVCVAILGLPPGTSLAQEEPMGQAERSDPGETFWKEGLRRAPATPPPTLSADGPVDSPADSFVKAWQRVRAQAVAHFRTREGSPDDWPGPGTGSGFWGWGEAQGSTPASSRPRKTVVVDRVDLVRVGPLPSQTLRVSGSSGQAVAYVVLTYHEVGADTAVPQDLVPQRFDASVLVFPEEAEVLRAFVWGRSMATP